MVGPGQPPPASGSRSGTFTLCLSNSSHLTIGIPLTFSTRLCNHEHVSETWCSHNGSILSLLSSSGEPSKFNLSRPSEALSGSLHQSGWIHEGRINVPDLNLNQVEDWTSEVVLVNPLTCTRCMFLFVTHAWWFSMRHWLLHWYPCF